MTGNLRIQVPTSCCTTCPALYCPVVVVVVVVVVVFAAALVGPSCSPYPPADEPEPLTIIPDGESGKHFYACGSVLLVIP